jgi:hypothetical protein
VEYSPDPSLSYAVKTPVEFSHDPAATFFKTCDGDFAQHCELYRSADGVQVSFSGSVDDIIFSPGGSGGYFTVRYSDTKLPIELRRTSDGSLITTLTSTTAQVNFSPDPAATYFTVLEADRSGHEQPEYIKRGELHSSVDGALVPLNGPIAQVVFSPDPNAAFFVVIYADTDKSAELRRTADASLISVLPGNGGRAFFSADPAATYLVWVEDYGTGNGTGYPVLLDNDKSAELRRTVDGSRIATLSGFPRNGVSNLFGNIFFSPDRAATIFVTHIDAQPVDIYLSAEGISVAHDQLIQDVTFLPDPTSPIFQVQYQDGRIELWDRQGSPAPHQITDLGLGQGTQFGPGQLIQRLDPQSRRVTTEYSDGRAYLLDIGWLQALADLPQALAPEQRSSQLARLACQGPLASGLFDEAELKPYLGEQSPQACR